MGIYICWPLIENTKHPMALIRPCGIYRIIGFLKIQSFTIMLYDCKMALMLIMQCTLEKKVEGKEMRRRRKRGSNWISCKQRHISMATLETIRTKLADKEKNKEENKGTREENEVRILDL
jgi:hypothetical protein